MLYQSNLIINYFIVNYHHITEEDTKIETDDIPCLNHKENYDRTRIQIDLNSN